MLGSFASSEKKCPKVLGNYLHCQCNFPAESGCSTSPARSVTIIGSSTCFASTVSSTLRDQFASQVSLNGSGTRVAHGNLKALAATSCWNGRVGYERYYLRYG